MSLVEEVAREARQSGLNKLYAEVVKGNPALKHHLGAGWSLTGAERAYLNSHTARLIEKTLAE